MNKRSFVFSKFVAAALVMSLALSGMAVFAQTAGAQSVTVAIGADPADLSPFVSPSMGRIAVIKTIYEFLLESNKMGADAVPMIAKSVEKLDDKSVLVTIFENVVDSAGNKITAEDVAWSYNTGIAGGKMRPLNDVKAITATGPYTVKFEFKVVLGPGGVDKILTECPVVSQKSFESSPDKFSKNPIGTGPYKLTKYVSGSSLTFERRPDYWQTDRSKRTLFSQANVQKVIYQIITEPAQHAIALETGKVQLSSGVSGDDIPRFEADRRLKKSFTVYKFVDNLTQSINFNGSPGNPLTNKELRQAIAYAIDTTAMCRAVAPGFSVPSVTLGNSNFGGYLSKWEKEPYYPYDLAKAKKLFAASGHKPGQLTFTLLGQNDSRTGLMAQVIQASLAKLGINVKISLVEPPVYNNLQYEPTAFDMILSQSAGGDFIFGPWLLVYDANRNKGTTSNFFKDDKLQSLLMTASSTNGFTPSNVDAFHQYQKEQMYAYAMLSLMSSAVSVKGITSVVRDTRGQIIPGACSYSSSYTVK